MIEQNIFQACDWHGRLCVCNHDIIYIYDTIVKTIERFAMYSLI